jgi:peptide/nickel transport system substrate-binding protein
MPGELTTGLDLPNVDEVGAEQLNRMVFETLFRFTPRLEVVPHLAESYDVASDGLSWTFKLRDGVRFHDGAPLDAAAAKASFDRLLGPERPLKGVIFEGLVRAVEAPDATTLHFRLERPNAFFPNLLALDATAVVNQLAVQKLGSEMKRSAVGAGSGPFRFTELVPGDRWVAVANDHYWGGRPKLDRVVARFFPEAEARAVALEVGSVQAIQRAAPTSLDRLQESGRIRLTTVQGTRVLAFGLNTLKLPFNKPQVRQALQYGLDRPSLLASAYGTVPGGESLAVAAAGPVANGVPGYAEIAALPYDPARAGALLTEASLGAGFTSTLWTTRGRFPGDFELAQALQQQLAKVGVFLKIETLEWGALLRATGLPIEENRSDFFLLGRSSTVADAQAAFLPFAGGRATWPPHGSNRCFYNSTELDELLARAGRAPDRVTRDEALRQAQELLVRDAPAIFLAAPREVVAASTRLNGLVALPTGHLYADEKTTLG